MFLLLLFFQHQTTVDTVGPECTIPWDMKNIKQPNALCISALILKNSFVGNQMGHQEHQPIPVYATLHGICKNIEQSSPVVW